ncbi:hypothetical protein E3P99_04124 [Wallemia hederae]|uniref:Uncharacterized protein n=1 Tax=Wallemia hederae TaxID=1540922 RepID=A0A4T0F9T3_9BASI|nr:hypothetical protein E3P99_04124 [Wallemia hederae]
MLSLKFSLLVLFAVIAKVAGLTIYTPEKVVQCGKISLTFEGGSAPYSIQVTDGVQAANPEFVDEIKDVQTSPYEYPVTSKEDKIGFVLHSGDEIAYSGE